MFVLALFSQEETLLLYPPLLLGFRLVARLARICCSRRCW
jgi:hypothetical protein